MTYNDSHVSPIDATIDFEKICIEDVHNMSRYQIDGMDE
jgi:hypothetical protein